MWESAAPRGLRLAAPLALQRHRAESGSRHVQGVLLRGPVDELRLAALGRGGGPQPQRYRASEEFDGSFDVSKALKWARALQA